MQRALVLVLLILATLAGCRLFAPADPIADLRTYLTEHVEDTDRRAKMLAEVDVFDARIREFEATSMKIGEEMRAANRNYDSSPEDLAKLFEKHNATRVVARDRILDALLRLRDLTTATQWEEITDAQIGEYRKRIVTTALATK
jgi:hypothetical protein